MNTAQPGSSGPATPEIDVAESNRNVKSDAGDLDPRDTAHPTASTLTRRSKFSSGAHRSPTSNCACWPNG
jgi:hypothetical protein